jgi:hypothetical protein
MRKDALQVGALLALLASIATAPAAASAAFAPAAVSSAFAPTSASFALAPTTASSASAPTVASAVYLESQPVALPVKPHSYYSHLSVHNLTWANWGASTATAQGTFTFQFCVEESCTVSPFYDESAAVTLTAIQNCGTRPSYTALGLEVSGTLPDSSFKSYRTSLACPTRPAARRAARRRKHG